MSVLAPSRRGLLGATAWSVPAVIVASAAPAYATSDTAPGDVHEPLRGVVVTGYKDPGQGQTPKGYYVLVECESGTVHTVQIEDDDKRETWRTATKQAGTLWYASGFGNSRSKRKVLLNGTTVVEVKFAPE